MRTAPAPAPALRQMPLSTSQRNLLIALRVLLVVLSLLAVCDFLTNLR